MMDQRVSLITLGVGDLATSAAFYEALGWKRAETEDTGIVVFELLGQVLGLYPAEALSKDLGVEVTPGFSGITLGYNVRKKAEVAEICARVEPAGGRVLKDPHDMFWGGHSAFMSDPDGYVWELSHNPFSPPAEDGSFTWGG